MISKENSEYEPYQGQIYDIDLQGNEMVEIPNSAKDELVIDKQGNVSLIKHIGKVIFDGSSDELWNISQNTNGTNRYSIFEDFAIPDNYSEYIVTPLKSNYFTATTFRDIYINGKVGISGYFNGTDNDTKRICISFNNNMSLEEFKQWLQTHNTTVYYELKEPQTINLGKLTDIITTLNGANNIFINGNIPTTISATYALDTKKYIDKKLAEISTAMIEEG